MNRKSIINIAAMGIAIVIVALLSGCMRYLTHDRTEVLLEGIDIDQTLLVAEYELKRGRLGASLTLWALRDQVFTASQAKRVAGQYFEFVGDLRKFDEWHLTWAIANMHRHGDASVQNALDRAYGDATERAEKIHSLANRMANNEELYMGDAHFGGRAYAEKHLVIPGNENYIQSFDAFIENRANRDNAENGGET